MIHEGKRLLAAIGRYFSPRARLFGLEGKEAGKHTLKLLLGLAAVLAIVAFGWLFLCVSVVLLLAKAFAANGWLWASFIMAVAHFALAWLLAKALRHKADKPLFPLITEEFKKDQQWLEEQNRTKPPS